jgi:ABC-2 type transport system permease protein
MNMATLMFPGMLMMGILFTASGLSGDWWKEKQEGTLRRALVGPHGAGAVLGGKVLAFALLAAAVACVGLGLGKGLMDMALPRPWWTLAWVVLTACGAYLAFLLLQSLATQRRAAEILVNMLLMPLCMVGGCFFPFEMMPKGLAAVGRMTPNGMAMVVMRETMDAGSAGQWWLAVGVAVAVMAALFGVCARQARARFVF